MTWATGSWTRGRTSRDLRRSQTADLEEVAVVRAVTLAIVVLLAVAAANAPAGAQDERERFDVRVFTLVPDPGQPEGIAVAGDGTVYVGTHNYGKGDADAPSKIFAYAPDGSLLRDYTVEGQNLDEDHGILAMVFDASGTLYVLDRNPARVFTLDPDTGEQTTYATFRDVPTCSMAGDGEECSDTVVDLGAFPDDPVFSPGGTMYVTDLEQGLIWRVQPGGGEAEVWFTDPRLESVFGPNGIQFISDGSTLLFAQTGSHPPGTTDPATGRLYTLPVHPDGTPGELDVFWEGQPADGPDGFAIAESGNVYVALAGANQVLVLAPDGEEIARIPATPVDNQQQEVPFDTPASVAFLGQRVLVTNQSFFVGNPDTWAVLDVFAGEEGLPLYRPSVGDDGDVGGEPNANIDGDADAAANGNGRGLPATGANGATVTALLLAFLGGAFSRRRARR